MSEPFDDLVPDESDPMPFDAPEPVEITIGLPAMRKLLAGERVEAGGVMVRPTWPLVEAWDNLLTALEPAAQHTSRPLRPDAREKLVAAAAALQLKDI